MNTRAPAESQDARKADVTLAGEASMSLEAHEREKLISEAAYRRYEARRGNPGDPIQDWLEAEAEVERLRAQAAEASKRQQ